MCYIVVDKFQSTPSKGIQNLHAKSLAVCARISQWQHISAADAAEWQLPHRFYLWHIVVVFVAFALPSIIGIIIIIIVFIMMAVLGACARGLLFWYFLRYFYAHFHVYAYICNSQWKEFFMAASFSYYCEGNELNLIESKKSTEGS